jgi:hypothetical protein
MRLLPKKKVHGGGAGDAMRAAAEAGVEAGERLASAGEVHAAAARQAAGEKGIIDDLRALRERNHIAALIVASLREAGDH